MGKQVFDSSEIVQSSRRFAKKRTNFAHVNFECTNRSYITDRIIFSVLVCISSFFGNKFDMIEIGNIKEGGT